jgi:hypothetical protein
MVDDLRKKLENIQIERSLVQTQLQEKLANLKSEELAYEELYNKRIDFEKQYFQLFQENIEKTKV